MTHTSTSRFS